MTRAVILIGAEFALGRKMVVVGAPPVASVAPAGNSYSDKVTSLARSIARVVYLL
jgi:hypothetical protein